MSDISLTLDDSAVNVTVSDALTQVTLSDDAITVTIDDDAINVILDDSGDIVVTAVDDSVAVTLSDDSIAVTLPEGIPGPAGQGVPTGGTAGQVLAKINGDDYNTEWVTPSAGGASTVADLVLGENVAEKALVHINASGQAVNADADNNRPVMGWCELGGTSGATVEITFAPALVTLTGLTAGSWYYLSTTPGGYTTTEPTTAGHIRQRIGRAYSSTSLFLHPSPPVKL